MAEAGDRFRSCQPLSVICRWWYDTVAILDDYSDACEATLPAGEAFTVEQVSESDPDWLLCRLDRARELKPQLIPKGRQVRATLFCASTPYRVESTSQQIEEDCERIGPSETG